MLVDMGNSLVKIINDLAGYDIIEEFRGEIRFFCGLCLREYAAGFS